MLPFCRKLLIGSKKVRGCKNGTDLLHHRAKYGGDRGLRAGCRRKSVMFLSVFVTLWKHKVCDNGNAMKQYKIFKTIVSLHTVKFVVVHLYSPFSVYPLRGKFIQEITIFRHFTIRYDTIR